MYCKEETNKKERVKEQSSVGMQTRSYVSPGESRKCIIRASDNDI